MVEQQYFPAGLTDSDDLSATATLHTGIPTSSAASAYPELAAYTTVPSSSFGLAGQCDSGLVLTPSSGIGSPPLHQISKLGQYSQQPTTPSQQPTPPGSTKMYHQPWPSQFDMNGPSSQSSSPMAHQAQVAPGYYMGDERRSPVPPSHNYMGAFGVSEGAEPQPMAHPYYINVGPQPTMQMPIHPRDMPPNAPILSEPHPSQFRHPRRASAEGDIHGLPDAPVSASSSPRRRALTTTATGRVRKRTSKSTKGAQSKAAQPVQQFDDYRNHLGQEVPPALKSNCPDEERCIFESRWEYRHQKGQDMWDSIQRDFQKKFGKCPGKETLQMKFKRGRAKYIKWESRDEELLREAWQQIESKRYQLIRDKFFELGGSRNMQLNPSDVEIKLVNDLKLEEGLYMEAHPDLYVRRRRKSSTVKKRGGLRELADDLSPDLLGVGQGCHEEEVISQVLARSDYKMEEDATNPGEMMDLQMWNSPQVKMEPGAMSQRDDRIARQACDEILRMSPGSQAVYGPRKRA